MIISGGLVSDNKWWLSFDSVEIEENMSHVPSDSAL